jgi:hypothetical protein
MESDVPAVVFSWLLQLHLVGIANNTLLHLLNPYNTPQTTFLTSLKDIESNIPRIFLVRNHPSSSNMDYNPAEHDEIVSQFCNMTGTKPAEVSTAFPISLRCTSSDFDHFNRLRSTFLRMGGMWKLP